MKMQGTSIYTVSLPLNMICDTNLVDFEQIKFYKLKLEKLLMLFFCCLSFICLIYLSLLNLYFYTISGAINHGSSERTDIFVPQLLKLPYVEALPVQGVRAFVA